MKIDLKKEYYVLKLKGFEMYIGDNLGSIVFNENKALGFNSIKQAKERFKIIKNNTPQLGNFKDYECVKMYCYF